MYLAQDERTRSAAQGSNGISFGSGRRPPCAPCDVNNSFDRAPLPPYSQSGTNFFPPRHQRALIRILKKETQSHVVDDCDLSVDFFLLFFYRYAFWLKVEVPRAALWCIFVVRFGDSEIYIYPPPLLKRLKTGFYLTAWDKRAEDVDTTTSTRRQSTQKNISPGHKTECKLGGIFRGRFSFSFFSRQNRGEAKRTFLTVRPIGRGRLGLRDPP